MGPYSHASNDMMKESSVLVCTDGRLVLEFTYDELPRIKSWHFATRIHHELIPKSLAVQAQQDPSMLDQITKNITRQGLTNSTLNYLRVSSHNRFVLSILLTIFNHSFVSFLNRCKNLCQDIRPIHYRPEIV